MKETHWRTMAGCSQYAKRKKKNQITKQKIEDNPIFKNIYMHTENAWVVLTVSIIGS